MRHLISKHLASRLTWARDGELTPRFGGKKLNRQVRRAITRDTRRAVEHAHAEIWEDRLDAFLEALFDASPARYSDLITYGQRTPVGAYVHSEIVVEGWEMLNKATILAMDDLNRSRSAAPDPNGGWEIVEEAVLARGGAWESAYMARMGHLMQDSFE